MHGGMITKIDQCFTCMKQFNENLLAKLSYVMNDVRVCRPLREHFSGHVLKRAPHIAKALVLPKKYIYVKVGKNSLFSRVNTLYLEISKQTT